jgi:hypothetical protein
MVITPSSTANGVRSLPPQEQDNTATYSDLQATQAAQPTQVAGLFGISQDSNRQAAEWVRSQRDNIAAAAQRNGVSPWAIGAVMFQEARNYNRDFGLDGDFDSKARAFVNATPGSAAATAAGIDLQDAAAGVTSDGTINTASFGPAQIQLRRVKELIDGGYINKPAGYDQDPTRAALQLSLDRNQTANLVGAQLRRISDDWVQRGGSDKIRSDPEAQYKLLTQLYSQYAPGESRANPNPELRTARLNESGQDAVANFSVIRKALYTNSPIYGFEGQRLPASQRYNPKDPLEGLPRRLDPSKTIDTPPIEPPTRAANSVNTALAAGLPLVLLDA